MDNRELVKKLSPSGEGGEAAGAAPVTYRKLVIFLIGDKTCAFDSDEVKEVVIVSDLYFIPFVPPYVAGLINRHWEPHTVLDLRVILDNEKLEASKVLIMNHGDDQIAFLISDILKIIQVPEGEIAAVPSSEGSSLFRGSFPFEGREVLIITRRTSMTGYSTTPGTSEAADFVMISVPRRRLPGQPGGGDLQPLPRRRGASRREQRARRHGLPPPDHTAHQPGRPPGTAFRGEGRPGQRGDTLDPE